jgi:DNA-directed RNA polymerase subunit RPC12/RpoP
MNHTCNGDFFAIESKPFYRCFMDSTQLDASALRDGAECPHCRRRIRAGDQLGEVRTRTVTQFYHPTFGWLQHSPLSASEKSP